VSDAGATPTLASAADVIVTRGLFWAKAGIKRATK